MHDSLHLTPGEKTILCIGAHPDDCELNCSGIAILWAEAGNRVIVASMTDGRSGHHILSDEEVVPVRLREAEAAARLIGAESRNLGFRDGYLVPSIENRMKVIALIRETAPDVIITNRPNDYHPDHRYASQLIQDSAYMLMVPHILPEIGPLRYNPVVFYWADIFSFPKEFRPDIVVDIDSVRDKKMTMIREHRSQVYEWLPFIERYPVPVPSDEEERVAWFDEFIYHWLISSYADRFRAELNQRYGKDEGEKVLSAEAFELCEYGTVPDRTTLEKIFSDAKPAG